MLTISISQQCQTAAFGLIASPLVQCLQISTLTPLITGRNSSIIPVLDNWMEAICASAPCNQTAFDDAAAALASGCASDLSIFGLSGPSINETLSQVFQAYPIVRELVCLKTVDTNSSAISNITSGANSTTIEESSYNLNTTNGTFCVSNLLEQVEEIAGFNLTVNKLLEVGMQAYSGNYSSVANFTNLPPTALCQDCIFAGADIVAQSYPQVWNISVGTNTTIASFLNDTCEAEGYNVTYDGTLPDTIYPSAVDSNYPFNLTTSNFTYEAGPDVVAPPTLFNSSASIASAYPSVTASAAKVASSHRPHLPLPSAMSPLPRGDGSVLKRAAIAYMDNELEIQR
jgi:hypothetical protein